jgi:hypothetical protein
MLKFQASIHGGDPAAAGPLAVTFEAAFESLESLPRLFIEPDGSFVWTGDTAHSARWQVDGNLIDRGDVLAYVELKGTCPEEQFKALLAALGWPEAKLSFQLPRRGAFLDEAAFRELATSDEGAI